MLETDKVFSGSIPENYDRYMVPLIFKPYAFDLAERAVQFSPRAVLEIAAGTGVVTRSLAPKLAPDATYVVTDLNPAMLDYARIRQPADDRIEWRTADAMALPFDDATFDLVCCQFGAMFFPDRPAAYREIRRVLKPGEHFLFNVWDRLEENILASDVSDVLTGMFAGDPPRFMARTPHGYHDIDLILSDLERSGFFLVEIETKAVESCAPSARQAAIAYCQGTPLRGEIEARVPDGLAAATDAVAAALLAKHGAGEIVAKIQAHIIVAVA